MLETLIAVLVVGALAGVGALTLLPWEQLAVAGMWLIVGGFAVGLPTGLAYHVWLYRALKPLGELPENWYWNPIELNRHVPEDHRRRVLTACYAGAAGFLVVVLGVIALGAAVAAQIVRP